MRVDSPKRVARAVGLEKIKVRKIYKALAKNTQAYLQSYLRGGGCGVRHLQPRADRAVQRDTAPGVPKH